MPYIKQIARKAVTPEVSTYGKVIDFQGITNAGELNYAITVMLNDYFARNKNYQAINDIMGALTGAQLEFYRRTAIPYENAKIQENGDV